MCHIIAGPGTTPIGVVADPSPALSRWRTPSIPERQPPTTLPQRTSNGADADRRCNGRRCPRHSFLRLLNSRSSEFTTQKQPNNKVERRAAALSQPESIYANSSSPSDAHRSYAACPLQRKLDGPLITRTPNGNTDHTNARVHLRILATGSAQVCGGASYRGVRPNRLGQDPE
jgi:hypothetical protein